MHISTYMKYTLRAAALGAAVFCTAVQVQALDVDCTPGSLASAVADPAAVTTLRLTGTVDASDLYFVGSSMTNLHSLDLGAVTIAAYSGPAVRQRTSYPAATIPAHAFTGSPISSLTLPRVETTIGDAAFAGTALSTLTLSPAVHAQGTGVFSSCTALTEVNLGGATTGSYTFGGCTALKTVNLAGATAIGEGDYAGCTSLTTVNGTQSVASIGNRAFDGCTALKSYSFGPALRTIGYRAFAGTGLTSANMTGCSSLQSIGAWAFAGCPALAQVTLPSGLAQVGEGAFFDCTALRSANFPAAAMADYVFKDAPLTDSNNLPGANVATIGDYALKGASGVKTLTLPNSLETIGTGAMEGMTGLTTIYAENLDHVPELGDDVWQGVEQKDVTLHVDPSTGSLFAMAPQWQDFHIETMSTANPALDTPTTISIQGRFDGATLLLRTNGDALGTVSLYDTTGTMLLTTDIEASNGAIDTSSFSTNIFIVVVSSTDTSRAVLKLLR